MQLETSYPQNQDLQMPAGIAHRFPDDAIKLQTTLQKYASFSPEPFVSAEEAARFLSIKRRHLLALARSGLAGAYPLGTGTVRKIWVFRLSELAAAIARKNSDPRMRGLCDASTGSPR